MSNSRRHLLLVEEHRDIRAAFAALFESICGYVLHLAAGTREALGITGRQNVDLAVVDLAQGDELGARLAMIRAWRRDGFGFPVIATSPRTSDALIVETLEAGGDDFLRKPYLFSELRARIQRHLTRQLTTAAKTMRVGGVRLPDRSFAFAGATVTPDMQIVFADGRRFPLSPKQVGLLREFNRHTGMLLLKEKLIYSVWGPDANTNSASVHQYLHLLRKLYREAGVDLSAFVTPESKAGWRIARHAAEPPQAPPIAE